MSDTSIRVSKETKNRLDILKRENESYEDVILRLTERDKWAGFGILSETETDTKKGMEKIRDEVRDGISEDINRTR